MNIDKQKGYLENLLKLIKENPELPIVPMVAGEIVADDSCGYWMGSWGSAWVDEYLLPKMGSDEAVCFKSDGDVFDTLEKFLPLEVWEALPDTESECKKIYDALPWTKAILIYIELPDPPEYRKGGKR